MKKTLALFAVLAMTSIASAATIKWNVSGNNTYVINDVSGNPYASQTVYLIAGADISTLTNPEQDKATFTEALEAITIATATSSATGTKPVGITNYEVSSPLMTAGQSFTFGVLLVSEDSQNGYYKLLTATGTPYADDALESARTGKVTSAWSATGLDKGAWTKSYAVAAVPEPSVALMGLLGLGMLLTRRRA